MPSPIEKLSREIIEKILAGEINSKEELESEKKRLCAKLSLDRFIRNSEILNFVLPRERERVLKILQKKPTRTISGVAIVAAMTKP